MRKAALPDGAARVVKRAALRLLAAGCVLSLTACAGLYAPPQPWEKGQLAKPEMTMDGDSLDAHFTQHIYGSKEGSAGGYGVGGGGCGCN